MTAKKKQAAKTAKPAEYNTGAIHQHKPKFEPALQDIITGKIGKTRGIVGKKMKYGSDLSIIGYLAVEGNCADGAAIVVYKSNHEMDEGDFMARVFVLPEGRISGCDLGYNPFIFSDGRLDVDSSYSSCSALMRQMHEDDRLSGSCVCSASSQYDYAASALDDLLNAAGYMDNPLSMKRDPHNIVQDNIKFHEDFPKEHPNMGDIGDPKDVQGRVAWKYDDRTGLIISQACANLMGLYKRPAKQVKEELDKLLNSKSRLQKALKALEAKAKKPKAKKAAK